MSNKQDNINRRTFIKELGIAGASTLSLFGTNSRAITPKANKELGIEPKKPNILLLMTDQQRWDAMGCSGDWVQTPNLDRIASEGVRFTNCVTSSPVCVPARLSLATGLYPHNTGVWNNQKHKMAPETPTWMQTIRDAGYRTSLFGKTHLHTNNGDLRKREHLMNAYGLDDVNEIGGPRASMKCLSYMTEMWEEKGLWKAYREDYQERFKTKSHLVRPTPLGLENDADVYVGQQAKKYLQNYNRQEPWFCWVSFGGPHEPWDCPEPYASMYNQNEMPKPVNRPAIGNRPLGSLDNLMKNRKKSPKFDKGDVGKMRADYAGNVTLIDDQIGEILDTIESRGELDNTVIVFCSDHGEMNGDYGLILKSNFLNGAVRIPFIVRSPDTLKLDASNRICDSPVEWIDIGPTLVELVDEKMEHRQFGKSLCPILDDTETTHREFAISEISREIMLLNQEWKIALNKERSPYLLFNVQDDPDEVNNLAGLSKMKQIEKQLTQQISEYLVQTQTKN
ncbi:MAG: sulfatase-like hydrolase/transferase [Candidatus Poribacteria bacterium]|nr:sulfatase-like hydrolase/transferase [Candidatus Poribacteria bacterium]